MIQDEATVTSIALHATASVRVPIDNSMVRNDCLSKAFLAASCHGQFHLVEYLLGKFFPGEDELKNIYIRACEHERFDFAELLSKRYTVDPETFSGQDARGLVVYGEVEGLQFLISKGFNSDLIVNSHFEDAFFSHSEGMFEYILSFPNVNPAADLLSIFERTRYLHFLVNLDILLGYPEVLAALDIQMVDMILGSRSSGETKGILLIWLAKNIPYLSWIPQHRKDVFADPESASINQPIADAAIGLLQTNNCYSTAAFIKAWNEALLGYATTIATVHGDSTFVDIFESYLITTLPEEF